MKITKIFLTILCLLFATETYAFQFNGIEYGIAEDETAYVAKNDPDVIQRNILIPDIISYEGKNFIVTQISDSAFSNCDRLESITIPHSVDSIGRVAFYNCSKLIAIQVDSRNKKYSSHEGVLHSKDGTLLIQYPKGKPDDIYRILESVTTIRESAFKNCDNLNYIYLLSSSLKKIEKDAFFLCHGLIRVYMGASAISEIEERAFYGCSSLTGIYLPYNVTSIKSETFRGCISLEEVHLTSAIDSIEEWAFEGCRALKQINIPNSVSYIGDCAFENCSSLTSIELPDAITSVSISAFGKCTKLSLVILPETLTEIKEAAFYECAISRINIPEAVTMIGASAFSKCANLSEITIPKNVSNIGNWGFKGCTNLRKIYIKNPEPGFIEELTFDADHMQNSILYIPSGTMDKYTMAPLWSNFKNIIEEIPTGIAENKNQQPSVYSSGNNIIVKEIPAGTVIDVFTLAGTKIISAKAEQNITQLTMQHGTYIVKAGNQTFKVIL